MTFQKFESAEIKSITVKKFAANEIQQNKMQKP